MVQPQEKVENPEPPASHRKHIPAAKPPSRATISEPRQRACPLTVARAKGNFVGGQTFTVGLRTDRGSSGNRGGSASQLRSRDATLSRRSANRRTQTGH